MNMNTEFTSDFIKYMYTKADVLEIAEVSTKMDLIISGILHVSDLYGKYVTRNLSLLCQIDALKNNTDVKNELRRILHTYTCNTIEKSRMLYKTYPDIQECMTGVQIVTNNDYESDVVRDYYLSLNGIKESFDSLLTTIKKMSANTNTSYWKEYFIDAEEDIKNIYTEIVSFEHMISHAFMEIDGIMELEKIRDNDKKSIKIKSLSDIAKYTYNMLVLLDGTYKIVCECKYVLLRSVNINDPTRILSGLDYNIENVHKIFEENFGEESGYEEDEEVEDFIDDSIEEGK